MKLDLTSKALNEVRRLRGKELEKLQADGKDTSQLRLRVMVVGGGCSGMSYKLAFEKEAPTEKDKLLKFEEVEVLVDNKSGLFLEGIEIDFSDGLDGTGFTFNNPKAKRTCGCGSSFSV